MFFILEYRDPANHASPVYVKALHNKCPGLPELTPGIREALRFDTPDSVLIARETIDNAHGVCGASTRFRMLQIRN